MNKINGLSDSPAQVVTLPIQDGSSAVLTLTYRPQQFGWFYDMVWNGNASKFTVNGRRLATFPNILRQFRNRVPFGIWVSTADGSEPTYQGDLLSGRVALYLLSPDDVAQVEALVFP